MGKKALSISNVLLYKLILHETRLKMRCDFLRPPIVGFILVQKYLDFNHMGKKSTSP